MTPCACASLTTRGRRGAGLRVAMGNSHSRNTSNVPDQFTRPQGLYSGQGGRVLSNAELRRLRRAIIDGKMSPCYPGREDASGANDTVLEECPICFLHYPSLNRSRYAPARERHPPVGGTSFRPGGSRRRDRARRARRAPGAGAPSSDA